MSKITIDLTYSKVGHVLAEDIYNSQGALIVSAYTTLNQYIIDKFRELGINQFKIFQPEIFAEQRDFMKNFKKSYEYKVLTAKEIVREVISTETIDSAKFDRLAQWINSEIEENRHIVNCLSAIRKSDEYTYYHSLNVAYYSSMVGRWLNLRESEIINIIKAGLLHDIGKIKVPKEILNKKGKLLPEEFEIIKKHSIYGFRIIEKTKGLDNSVKSAVLMHHEREDGTGYPLGHIGKNIDQSAKIVAVADVYDAMISERVYGRKYTPFEVFDMFMAEGIKLYDRAIVTTFIKGITPCYVGAKVALNTGEVAEIVYIPQHSITKPVIKLKNKYIDLYTENKHKITALYF